MTFSYILKVSYFEVDANPLSRYVAATILVACTKCIIKMGRELGRKDAVEKWATRDSNPRPTACKAAALTN